MRLVSLLSLSLLVACKSAETDETGETGVVDTGDTDDTDPNDTDPVIVDADGDGSMSDVDCDDADPHRFPGNPEVCDAVDNDCDEVIGTDLVTWTSINGVDTDLTATFLAGTSELAAAYSLADDGTLRVCGGTWYVNLDVAADTTLEGFQAPTLDGVGLTTIAVATGKTLSASGVAVTSSNFVPSGLRRQIIAGIDLADDTTLHLADSYVFGSAIGVRVGSGSVVDVTDTEVTGCGTGIVASVASAMIDITGGAFQDCTQSAISSLTVDLLIDGTEFTTNTGGDGGAISQIGGTLTIADTSFTDNAASGSGGALHLSGVTANLGSSVFHGNDAFADGGAVHVVAGTYVVDDCTFEDNSASSGGALGLFSAGPVAGSNTTITGGSFLRNTATTSGGAIIADCSASTVLVAVTFGDAADDNTPTDFFGNSVDADLDGVVTQTVFSTCD